jgi:hypothetical protein
MKANFFWLLVASLAVWRVTHLLIFEDGPWNIFNRARHFSSSSFWTALTGCFYCLSVWIAAPCAVLLGESWTERALLWPALSGAAILMERATAPSETAPAPYIEQPEENYDVLRQR